MSRELTFSQGQHSRQVHWLVGYAIEALTQHTHELEPVILYLFHQAVILLDSVASKEKRYGGDLIECRSDVRQSLGSHKILLPIWKLS